MALQPGAHPAQIKDSVTSTPRFLLSGCWEIVYQRNIQLLVVVQSPDYSRWRMEELDRPLLVPYRLLPNGLANLDNRLQRNRFKDKGYFSLLQNSTFYGTKMFSNLT